MRFNSAEDRIYWEQNEGKRGRLQRYRFLAGLNESDEITDIDDYAFDKVCMECGCNPHLFKAELLNEDKKYWLKESIV